MAGYQRVAGPRLLSMEVVPQNETESEYRIESGGNVKYVRVAPGALHADHLPLPLSYLPALPYSDASWTVAHISRDTQSGELKIQLSGRKLAGVESVWHNNSFDILSLQRTKRLSTATFETLLPDPLRMINTTTSSSLPVRKEGIAKLAHFEWEIPRIERETRIYQVLHHRKVGGLAPRFLGHIHENGRTMGFLLEKIQGRTCASVENLQDCEAVLKNFHALGLIHGDVNRFNFLVADDEASVRLIDFEQSEEVAADDDREQRQLAELHSLRAELMEDSGRGGGYRPASDGH